MKRLFVFIGFLVIGAQVGRAQTSFNDRQNQIRAQDAQVITDGKINRANAAAAAANAKAQAALDELARRDQIELAKIREIELQRLQKEAEALDRAKLQHQEAQRRYYEQQRALASRNSVLSAQPKAKSITYVYRQIQDGTWLVIMSDGQRRLFSTESEATAFIKSAQNSYLTQPDSLQPTP